MQHHHPTRRQRSAYILLAISCSLLTPKVSAQVTNARSSIESTASVNLFPIDEGDDSTLLDEQFASSDPLGPITAIGSVTSESGTFIARTTTAADFVSNAQCSFESSMSYQGSPSNDIDISSFGHTNHGIFEYDFSIPSEGTLNISGILINGGPSPIEFSVVVSVLAEFMPGSGFTGAFFEQIIFDTDFDSENFDLAIPLESTSGSYRVRVRFSHSGIGQPEIDLRSGSLNSSISIETLNPCIADLTGDDQLDFFDVSAFLDAFGAQESSADFTADGAFDFFDVSAFLDAFSQGCP